MASHRCSGASFGENWRSGEGLPDEKVHDVRIPDIAGAFKMKAADQNERAASSGATCSVDARSFYRLKLTVTVRMNG
jgi:hypothetical protein